MADFRTVEAPISGLYRVAHRKFGPFTPADWSRADTLGTFTGRFDDPRSDLQKDLRFRVVYCASNRRGALGETLARFRQPTRLTSTLDTIVDDEPMEESCTHAADPDDHTRGLVEAGWQFERALGHTTLGPSLRFVDLGSARTLQQLRASFDLWMPDASAQDVDLSLVMRPSR